VPVIFDRAVTPGVLRLEGEVDIADARQLKEILLEAVGEGGAGRISLEMTTGLDVTAVQLLWAAEREARASGMVLALAGPVPPALRATVDAAGFERFPFADSGTDEGAA
jgi:anti-anti-sigma regulatory factor